MLIYKITYKIIILFTYCHSTFKFSFGLIMFLKWRFCIRFTSPLFWFHAMKNTKIYAQFIIFPWNHLCEFLGKLSIVNAPIAKNRNVIILIHSFIRSLQIRAMSIYRKPSVMQCNEVIFNCSFKCNKKLARMENVFSSPGLMLYMLWQGSSRDRLIKLSFSFFFSLSF